MGKVKKIQDFSFKYEFIRVLMVRWLFNHVYHRRFIVRGKENIPENRPVIFAPNHQNAVIDALVLVSSLKKQPVFLARQDVFRAGMISSILRFLKIMPVYRIRDGYESLSKNDEVFEKAVDVLHDKKHLCLMPEGNHGSQRKLRAIVKGMFRIAFMGQAEYKKEPGVIIIPVGIEYSHYNKFYQDIILNFGKPIEINEFWEVHEKEPARAINMIRDRLQQELSAVMIDIRSDIFYESIYFIQKIYPEALKNTKSKTDDEIFARYQSSQQIVKKLCALETADPDKMKRIDTLARQYQDGLKSLHLRDRLFYKENYSFFNILLHVLLLLMGFPFFVFGFINNLPLWILPQKAVVDIKDKQFHSSVKFGILLIMLPIYYILMYGILRIFTESDVALIYTLLSFISGLMAFPLYTLYKRMIGKVRYSRYKRQKKESFVMLTKMRADLLNLLKTI